MAYLADLVQSSMNKECATKIVQKIIEMNSFFLKMFNGKDNEFSFEYNSIMDKILKKLFVLENFCLQNLRNHK